MAEARVLAWPDLTDALARATAVRVTAGQQVAVALQSLRKPTAIRVIRVLEGTGEEHTARIIRDRLGYTHTPQPDGSAAISVSLVQALSWLTECGILQRRHGPKAYAPGPRPYVYRLSDLGHTVGASLGNPMTGDRPDATAGEFLLTDALTRYQMDLSRIGWDLYQLLWKGRQRQMLRILGVLKQMAMPLSRHDIFVQVRRPSRTTKLGSGSLSHALTQLIDCRCVQMSGSPARYDLTDLGATVARHTKIEAEANGQPVVHSPTSSDYREHATRPVMQEADE